MFFIEKHFGFASPMFFGIPSMLLGGYEI
jgi:hypothetical protein